MKKTNVLFYAPSSPPIGGIATWFDIVYKNVPEGFNFYHLNSAVSLTRQRAKKLIKFFIKLKIFLKHYLAVKKTIKCNHIDILHIATSGGAGFIRDFFFILFAKKNHVKTIIHLHFGRVEKILKKKNFEYFIMNRVFRKVDKIIAIDKTTYKSIINLNYLNVYLVNNPVEHNKFLYNGKSTKFLYAGTLNRQKGIYELINGFKCIDQEDNKWTLDLFGPIDFDEELISLINSCNEHVKWYGEIKHTDLLSIMKNYSFMILPSYTEGMPYCVLEAGSLGVPVLCTSVGQLPEIITNPNLLFKPKSVIELVKCVSGFIRNDSLREQSAHELYDTINKFYNVEVVMNKLKDIWRN